MKAQLSEAQIAHRKKWGAIYQKSQYINAIKSAKKGKLPERPIAELSSAAKRGVLDGFRIALLHAKQRKQQAV